MPCYGVDTTPIERASELLKAIEIDLAEANADKFAAYTVQNQDLLQELVSRYLAAVSCFFDIMLAVADRTLTLEREEHVPVNREYLRSFFPLYRRAVERSLRHLEQLLATSFRERPELRTEFVAQMVESQTVQEQVEYVSSVNAADRSEQAQEHSKSGKEIVDSVKDFLKGFISDRRILRITLRKKYVDQSFRVINEVLGMVRH
jgi:hypothetical protein